MSNNFEPVINELMYASYRTQRMLDPDRDPESLVLIYGPQVADYEDRFLKDFIKRLFECTAEDSDA